MNNVDKLTNVMAQIAQSYKKSLDHEDDQTTPKECGLIYLLLQKERTMSELAEFLGVTPATITAHVDKLIEKEFLERTYDKNDRRKIYISLSPHGKKIAQRMHEKKKELAKQMLSTLTDKQQEELIHLLGKVVKGLQNVQ